MKEICFHQIFPFLQQCTLKVSSGKDQILGFMLKKPNRTASKESADVMKLWRELSTIVHRPSKKRRQDNYTSDNGQGVFIKSQKLPHIVSERGRPSLPMLLCLTTTFDNKWVHIWGKQKKKHVWQLRAAKLACPSSLMTKSYFMRGLSSLNEYLQFVRVQNMTKNLKKSNFHMSRNSQLICLCLSEQF